MNVISLFSGCGGMDLGFVRAGCKIVYANDVYHDAVETYRMNIGDHIVESPIEQIDHSTFPKADIVIGGFPCQGFSIANMKRNKADTHNSLYTQMLGVVQSVKPKYVIAENVKGILSLDKGEVFQLISKDFASIGYKTKYALLNAADYGIAQIRWRVFIMACRDGVVPPDNFPPPPTHSDKHTEQVRGLKTWVSINDVLREVEELSSKNDNASTFSTYKLRFNGYLGHRVVDGERPSPTITARGDDKGGVVVIHHPDNSRRMTARELACIQGFPAQYKFYGTRTSIYRQVGNAVPPALAQAVAESLKD